MQPYDVLILDNIDELFDRYETFIEQNPGPYTIDVRTPEFGVLYHAVSHSAPSFEMLAAIREELLIESGSKLYIHAAKFNRSITLYEKKKNNIIKIECRLPIVQLFREEDTATKLSEEDAKQNISISQMLDELEKTKS